jgi:hypothetical protein
MDSRVKRDPTAQKRIVGAVANTYRHGRAETISPLLKSRVFCVAEMYCDWLYEGDRFFAIEPKRTIFDVWCGDPMESSHTQ